MNIILGQEEKLLKEYLSDIEEIFLESSAETEEIIAIRNGMIRKRQKNFYNSKEDYLENLGYLFFLCDNFLSKKKAFDYFYYEELIDFADLLEEFGFMNLGAIIVERIDILKDAINKYENIVDKIFKSVKKRMKELKS